MTLLRICSFGIGTPIQELSLQPMSSRPQSTDFLGLSSSNAIRSSRSDRGPAPGDLDGLSPVVGDSWASMFNTPLLPMFQKLSNANNNATGPGQTVDIAAAKLNDLYGTASSVRVSTGPKSSVWRPQWYFESRSIWRR